MMIDCLALTMRWRHGLSQSRCRRSRRAACKSNREPRDPHHSTRTIAARGPERQLLKRVFPKATKPAPSSYPPPILALRRASAPASLPDDSKEVRSGVLPATAQNLLRRRLPTQSRRPRDGRGSARCHLLLRRVGIRHEQRHRMARPPASSATRAIPRRAEFRFGWRLVGSHSAGERNIPLSVDFSCGSSREVRGMRGFWAT